MIVAGLLVAQTGLVAGVAAASSVQKKIEKGNRLLSEGQFHRAGKLFAALNEQEEGASVPALLGLAGAQNGLGQHADAYQHASEALVLATEMGDRARASGEVAYAIAAEPSLGSREELEKVVSEIRRYLEANPAGDLADSLRVELCTSRRGAGIAAATDDVPLDLQSTELEVIPPRRIHTPNPSTTERERRRRKSHGSAEGRGVVDTDGCLVDIEAEGDMSPVWAESLEKILPTWVFEPARLEGKPVAVYYQVHARYEIR